MPVRIFKQYVNLPILLLGILGVALPQDLHRTNALKNVLAGLVNGVAAVYFVISFAASLLVRRLQRRTAIIR